jgi:hypothetical protein
LDQSIEKIRGINQRALAINWIRMAGDHKIPRFQDFDPGARIHDPKKLAIWNVEQRDGQIVLRALFSGTLLNEPFSASWSGKTLEELTPPSLRFDILSGAHESVRTGCATANTWSRGASDRARGDAVAALWALAAARPPRRSPRPAPAAPDKNPRRAPKLAKYHPTTENR